jgi:hypothetical protein
MVGAGGASQGAGKMRYSPSMRFPLLRQSLAWMAGALAVSCLAGCGNDDEVSTIRYAPDLVAATVPDSIAAGSPLDIKVHWLSTLTCQSFEGFTVNALNDSVIQVVAVAVETRDPKAPCSPREVFLEGGLRINDPPRRHFHIDVYGARQLFPLEVEGDAAGAPIERHRITVENSVDGTWVAGATAKIVDLATQDTLATLTTDMNGAAETALPCAGATRAYKLRVVGASGRQAELLFQSNPAHCGIPERTAIRL